MNYSNARQAELRQRPDPDLEPFKDIPRIVGENLRKLYVKMESQGSIIPMDFRIEPLVSCCEKSMVSRGGRYCAQCGKPLAMVHVQTKYPMAAVSAVPPIDFNMGRVLWGSLILSLIAVGLFTMCAAVLK